MKSKKAKIVKAKGPALVIHAVRLSSTSFAWCIAHQAADKLKRGCDKIGVFGGVEVMSKLLPALDLSNKESVLFIRGHMKSSDADWSVANSPSADQSRKDWDTLARTVRLINRKFGTPRKTKAPVIVTRETFRKQFIME